MRPSRLVALSLAALAASPAAADEVLEFVVQSFALEEQAPRKKSVLRSLRGARETRSTITRVLPDRLRLRIDDAMTSHEVIVVGERLFERVDGNWQEGPAHRFADDPPKASVILRERLVEVVEGPRQGEPGGELRVFTGRLEWARGVFRNEGAIEIHVAAGTHLPVLARFSGRCSDEPCSWEQTFEYGTGIAVEPPVP